jgi:sugar lactone lactonase YvrE
MNDAVVLVASGFGALEGPVVDDAGALYFSEVKRGGVYRRSPAGKVDLVVPDRLAIGGLCLHAEGGLVVSGPDLSHIRDGQRRTLFEVTWPDGWVNDIHADRAGAVLAGVMRRDGPGALVRVTGEHEYEVVHHDIYPNGIAYSPDGSRLYAVDMQRRRVIVFGDRTESFSTADVPGLPDGMATDEDGFVWIAFYRGGCVARFGPDGGLARVVEMPVEKPLSLCFAGPDRTDLYIVTGSSDDGTETGCIFSLPVDVPGTPVSVARF